jgi:multidrug efflux pump
VFGVIPLILASGAGAVSRFNMGLVIASGLSIGTLLTLFMASAIYVLIAADHSRELEPGSARVAPMGEASGTT